MTTATTALRDAADTIRDAAGTGLQSIGGLLEDAKHRVDSVQIPKVTIKKRKRGGWTAWLVLAGIAAVAAVMMKRSSSSTSSATPMAAEPAAA